MVANGHLPYGYKADETLHYDIDEPKAAVIREIFTRVSCGEAFVDIMASLNARGINTSYGRPWGRSSFQKILSNERYRGIYIYGDVRKEGGIPRIISDRSQDPPALFRFFERCSLLLQLRYTVACCHSLLSICAACMVITRHRQRVC